MKNITNGTLVRILEDLKLDGVTILNKGTEDLAICVTGNQVALHSLKDSDIQLSVDSSLVEVIEQSNVIYVDFKGKKVL